MKSIRASSSAGGTRNTYSQTVNLVSDYGAVSGGSAATNNAALASFNTALAGFSGRTHLFIPPGDFTFSTSFAFSNAGGKDIFISAYGAILRGAGGFGTAGQGGTFPMALMETTAAGNATVTLVTSGDTSLFSVGQWVRVTEGDLQGGGQPPNPWKMEFKKIQSIGTGTLTFTEPLLKSYSSTYPNYNAGSPGLEPNAGGPASIYGLRTAWDSKIEMAGAYIPDNSNLFYGRGRDVTYTNMYFETYGPTASDSRDVVIQGCTVGTFGEAEIDKMVTNLTIRNNTFNAIVFQSPTIDNLYADNNTCRTGQYWRGVAGGQSVITNLNAPTFWFGLKGYGVATGNATLINCNAAAASYDTSYRFALADYGQPGSGALTITSNDPQRWAVPNGWYVLLDGSGNFSGIDFQVTDIAFSGGVTTISTTLSTPVPGTAGGFSAPWYIHPHPGKDTTLITCTGNSVFTTASGNPANSPIFGWS
jgi:hypothetical protein